MNLSGGLRDWYAILNVAFTGCVTVSMADLASDMTNSLMREVSYFTIKEQFSRIAKGSVN